MGGKITVEGVMFQSSIWAVFCIGLFMCVFFLWLIYKLNSINLLFYEGIENLEKDTPLRFSGIL